MNAELVIQQPLSAGRRDRRESLRGPARRSPRVTFRAATAADAPQLHALIESHVDEGHLLPRQIEELRVNARRFVIALVRGRIVGCAELAPLSSAVAEVRSLVVDESARSLGIGGALVIRLRQRARRDGFARLCAFTFGPAYFVRMGFTVVPHTDLPEKIARDCTSCALFGRCGQHAVVLPLTRAGRG